MAFSIVFKNILAMLFYMAFGFTLVKAKVASSNHGKTMSAILVYGCTPGMIISSFQVMPYSKENAINVFKFFFVTLILQIIFYLLMILVLGKKLEQGKYRILTCGSFMGNVGFFGTPIVTAIFPNEPIVSCYAMTFAASMNLLVFTLGEFLITKDKKYISLKKAIINPTILAMLVAVPMFLLDFHLPAEVVAVPTVLKAMSAPICMIVLGLRLASMNIKEVFGNPFAYAVSALKLIVFPLFCYAIVYYIPWLDSTLKISLLLTAGCPCAAVILSLAELHEMEQKPAAYTVLMASIFCVITLPMLSLLAG